MSKEMLVEVFEAFGNFLAVKFKNHGKIAFVYFSRSENAEEAMATLNKRRTQLFLAYGTFLKVSPARAGVPRPIVMVLYC